MPTRDQLIDALMKANDSGDTEGAGVIADMINKMDTTPKETAKSTFDAMPWYKQVPQAADDLVRRAADSASFGYADKLSAKIGQLVGSGSYEDNLKKERQMTADAGERAGSAGIAADLGGGVLAAGATGGAGATTLIPRGAPLGVRLLSALGLGAVDGAGYGALNAAGHDTDVGEGAMTGAAFGAVSAPLVEGVTTGVNALLGRRNGLNVTPSVDALESNKNAAYKKVEDIGAMYPDTTIRREVGKVTGDLTSNPHSGVREARHPAAFDFLDQMNNVATSSRPSSLYDLELMRQDVGNDVIRKGGSEGKFGMDMKNALDNIIGDTNGVKVNPGYSPDDALSAVTYAREANRKFSGAKEIKSIMDAASRSEQVKTSESMGNELRSKFASILNDDSKASFYTPDELGLMEKVVSGSKGANIARSVGSKMGGLYGKSAAAGLGATLGGAIGSSPGAAIGGVAGVVGSDLLASTVKGIANRSTKKATEDLLYKVSTGNNRIKGKLPGPLSGKSENTLSDLLTVLAVQNSQ